MNNRSKTNSNSKTYKLPLTFQALLTEEEKPLYEDYFNTKSSKALRKKLVEFFEKKITASFLKTDKENKYEMPSWSEYQADAIGSRRALREIIQLLKG